MQFRKILFFIGVGALSIFSLAPFLWEVITSLKSPAEIFSTPITYLPIHLSLMSYIKVFTRYPFMRYILNSIIVAGGTTLLTVGVGAVAAYALARLRIKGSGLWQRIFLLVALFPPVILVIPLYEMIQKAGLMNNYLALILPYTALNLPFAIWVLTGFFKEIPLEIEEAAKVDGFSRFGILTRIILPLAAPALATTSILVFIFAWNEFLLALTFMTQPMMKTVPVGIALLSGVTVYEVPWDQISAAVVATTLPLMLVVLFFQRKIIEGLTAGAVKG